MKHKIRKIVLDAAQKGFENGVLPSSQIPEMEIEEPRISSHGDFSTNFAMVSAGIQKMPPRKIAQTMVQLIETLGKTSEETASLIEKVEIAGPGFINFFLSKEAWHPVVDRILEQDKKYGASDMGKNEKVQVEFVSANPTGPLHVGHGRGAAVGDSVGNILGFAGFDVQKEYYINDSGRQIRTLGTSVWLRLLQKSGKEIEFPDDCYKGDYIKELACEILEKEGKGFVQGDEKEAIALCAKFAAKKILKGIKEDLSSFGVTFDQWFSEQSLYDSGRVQKAIDDFTSKDLIYKEDGALWFRTQDFGDEKNRVVVRNNGLTTYFASDIAYHMEKYDRGFDKVIDVWGADHHGYIKRIDASVVAQGKKSSQFEVILVQLVNLLRGGKPFQMSTRAGEFVTLKDIVDEVGKDAARFMFLSRSYDSGLDFDLELAKQKNSNNPVYYVQYVHARITGILLKAKQENIIQSIDFNKGKNLNLLTTVEEINLIKILDTFKANVEKSAQTLHPHIIFTYLMTLASAFHGYYNKHKVITENRRQTLARLSLVLGVKKVIRNGLALLGVNAPERM
ncbi:MAG: arginine--tRNA ligase [Desulfobacula sp.]|jgi:arginyl-tRNA synthetase|uniref:arginine--tRNA ligase n=1 Tax=Desulfobacula sp. TaxID=2593537 RepID=UPI001D46A450|nr:arginine--tRNA ligase [Desulfobacula sp.]MBT3804729.1 arginine--tRNA ligase [Desulfobacula sp.]MBT4025207.1 arginine--tRNA ligase [Desulfobacula sp.]MBT4200663.1 arginine--tRNA ligase [Desulfobacula sp.]MBT4507202.1 arginine--tRNA ligase [Desulfobacula sp.]